MNNNKPPTLREILFYKKETDSNIISVSKQNEELLYSGSIDTTPDNILNLRIVAWDRKDGIYISE